MAQPTPHCHYKRNSAMLAAVAMLAALNTQMASVNAISPLPSADASISRPNPSSRPNNKTDRPFDGPLAPGLQVSGGSRLKRAKNKIKKAARNMRAELRLRSAATTGTSEASSPTEPLQQQQSQQQSQQQQSQHSQQSQPQQQQQTEVTPTFSNVPEPVWISIHPPRPPTTAAETTKASSSPTMQSSDGGISKKAILFMSLLAIQFGIQPVLVKRFAPRGICKSSVVMTQELVKGVIALFAFYGSTSPKMRSFEISRLTLRSWLTMAGIPAAIYTVQNLASLLAYQNLEALTFNVLNQTKTLSAALCCFLVMGKRQSKVQALSLILLLVSALVIEGVVSFGNIVSLLGNGVATIMPKGRRFTHGVLPCLFASFLSGLAGALTQKNLQGVTKKKVPSSVIESTTTVTTTVTKATPINPYLFSMELTVASVLVLTTSLFFSQDGKQIGQHGFFHLWTPKTMIPILTNSFGGILVGLVTKHAGSVQKGFALIFGILLSGFLQAGSHGISSAQIVGGLLAATSLWMHSCSRSLSSTMPKLFLANKEQS
ncbi:unnamed protein product [Cylindrotheca closterium]|uniref:Sugar phosphate transporter domain-containing protein n=1 Tax=Cylindrotheca closterium TaxID=2856 RepID=A0AAD2CDW3_9STRA|nr:unnamed protein product [Cylindrotheca closterium]